MRHRLSHLSYAILFAFCLFAGSATAQDNVTKLNAKLKQSEDYIHSLEGKETYSVQDLSVIRVNIQLRKALIEALQQSMRQDSLATLDICQSIDSLDAKRRDLEHNHLALLANQYKQQQLVHPLHILLSQKQIQEIFTQGVFVKQYEHYKQLKQQEQASLMQSLEQLQVDYNTTISANRRRVESIRQEQSALEQRLATQENVLKELEQNRTSIRRKAKSNEVQRKVVEATVNKTIAAQVTPIIKPKPTTVIPKQKPRLSTIDKSGLPWPVDGIVVSKFGRQRHETLPDVYVINNGIDVAVSSSQQVKAVTSGTVVKIEEMNHGLLVLVKGETHYYLYSDLDQLSVTQGQQISQGTVLGRVSKGLHFEIWKGKKKIDPQSLLSKS